ncbi:hypothetical protein N7489_011929 [Penicillium chrysogenum]|uniref:Uncharacterized protein n=1 Tax=Penicillium chrysogenum TaxID=5076 RepID=A0ABQ8W2F9_PENCH|nr:uncharacterized protein N7525_006126 [Penicillium rubens]XP_056565300.1 uncharacterized protein N7489_011929 [Penicillium chrysogenum]KAJ5231221.1 hypothetical protein N7489_011929 [Penicillium chrysogenum]KAJ5253546.1 hypothetical protein N7505_012209 [Penicillium chrysogenum]KAJ5260866.1 hypothetical protein N7524_008499 [Penicillium chrysogenum]KAJ5840938.1 hypothetical protein N7525_006126 [Penicillium rubens]KAJ5868926.1 hypothetical protein N7534_003479 [Penicillium rubens]
MKVWIALAGPVGTVLLPNVAIGARENPLPDPYEVITVSKSWICSLKWGRIVLEIARTPS